MKQPLPLETPGSGRPVPGPAGPLPDLPRPQPPTGALPVPVGKSRVAAFFDLDRTMIDVNSGWLYARYEFRAGRISARQLAESALWMLLYHLSLVDMDRAYRKAVQHYRGLSSQLIGERTQQWFELDIAHRLQPGARAMLEQHRAEGHLNVLLTASSCYLAESVTRAWGMDAWLANVFPSDESGCLVGDVAHPLCFGAGKVAHAERWAERNGVELGASYFYSDSFSDLPMLERVGHPRVVNPDPRLRRGARQRGWPILDWSRAPSPAALAG